MKVCIPSKDRASIIKTHVFFKPSDVLIFVEPQEVKRYQIFCPEYTIVNIEKTDQGLIYSRNFILNYVKESKLIMADDDINFIGTRNKEFRYDKMSDFSILLKDFDDGLDKYCGYGIPNDMFTYFSNKGSNNQRFSVNKRYLAAFYGINKDKIIEHKISYDPSIIHSDDIDFSTQIILNDENVCIDYNYAFNADQNSTGGLSKMRNLNTFNNDNSFRENSKSLSDKYGIEFLKMSHDKKGYLKSYYLNFSLMMKRKEIVKKNYQKYLEKINS